MPSSVNIHIQDIHQECLFLISTIPFDYLTFEAETAVIVLMKSQSLNK